MPRPPERVLLFRSARHLGAALDALRADSPGCDITVVATPAAGPALDAAGIDAAHRIVYRRTPTFRPLPFLASPAGVRAIAGRFDRVCVLWSGPEGDGFDNVNRTALAVSPRGFTAITADGRFVAASRRRCLGRPVRRALVSMGVALGLGLFVFAPARLLHAIRR